MKEVQEIKDGFVQGLKERLSSPFYGYFLISWIVWNWKILYTTFFVSNESIIETYRLLKVEYISLLIKESCFSYLFLYPLFSVGFLVWIAPFITHIVYKKVARDKQDLRSFDLILERENAEVETQKIEKTVEKNLAEKKLFDVWREEYKKFEVQPLLFKKFQQILDSTYDYFGYVKYNNDFFIDKDILAFSHSNGLVSFQDQDNRKIKLTEKGMFFVSQYSNKIS